MSILVALPEGALLDQLGSMPDGVELVAVSPTGADDRARAAEVIVLAPELRQLLGELASFERLRLVQALNAGVEWLLPLVPPGVTLCNASGAHDIPVAEWVVAAILATYKEFPRYWRAQQQGTWDMAGNALVARPEDITGDDLEAKRVLIVGHGSIGRAVEARLSPFGADVVGVALHPRHGVHPPTDLPELVPTADVVVLLAPLTDATRGTVDAVFLGRMRDGAVLVNAARGALVDHAALEHELRAGRLRAVLDVTEPEPLPEGHPLWSSPNCFITPHTAGSARRWLARAYCFAGDQIRRYAAGEPLLNVRSEY